MSTEKDKEIFDKNMQKARDGEITPPEAMEHTVKELMQKFMPCPVCERAKDKDGFCKDHPFNITLDVCWHDLEKSADVESCFKAIGDCLRDLNKRVQAMEIKRKMDEF